MTPFSSIETPAVLVDEAKLEANLLAMQQKADANGVSLRPHVKTHKSLEIGRRQLAHGATGLTVASVDEALVFLSGDVASITIARPVVDVRKFQRLFSHPAAKHADLSIVVDSEQGCEAVSVAAKASGLIVGLLLKIDVGLHRCGLLPSDLRLGGLVQRIVEDPKLEFRGLLSHAGHAYAAQSSTEAAAIAEEERTAILGARDALEAVGIDVPVVSVGATPTVLACNDFSGITEIRPGNYVFLDLLPVRAGVASVQDVSLTVLATVISKNAQYFITDAGSKTLSSDAGVHGMTGTSGFGCAYPVDHYLEEDNELKVDKVSEEHGMILRAGHRLEVGDQVRIIPNHACPVANLAREYNLIGKDGISTFPVDATKCSR
jgi:D-serine deaminase-like pyridoxal phosphate-dependent protein